MKIEPFYGIFQQALRFDKLKAGDTFRIAVNDGYQESIWMKTDNPHEAIRLGSELHGCASGYATTFGGETLVRLVDIVGAKWKYRDAQA